MRSKREKELYLDTSNWDHDVTVDDLRGILDELSALGMGNADVLFDSHYAIHRIFVYKNKSGILLT